MANPVASIIRAATRKPGEPLNILTFPTHERYESGLAKTGHNFWAARSGNVKDWNRKYAPVPDNYILLDPNKGDKQLPLEVDFDLVLSQNKFGQFQWAQELSRRYHLPLVSLEHTLPVPQWGRKRREALLQMRGHINVFISEFSRKAWGFTEQDAQIVHHGVDTDVFSPNDLVVEKKAHVLAVVNDWINRDWCCGFSLWQESAKGLPTFVVGDTPGLSKPAASIPELVMRYREAQVFINTSLISPVPTALLEAMSCGCPVVSTENCMIPEVIQHGVNGFMSNDPTQLRAYCRLLLDNESLRKQMGAAARQTILDRFSMGKFVANWSRVFDQAANIVFTG